MRTAWGRSLRKIVAVDHDGTLVLQCGHRKKHSGKTRWGTRTACLECVPDGRREASPPSKRGTNDATTRPGNPLAE